MKVEGTPQVAEITEADPPAVTPAAGTVARADGTSVAVTVGAGQSSRVAQSKAAGDRVPPCRIRVVEATADFAGNVQDALAYVAAGASGKALLSRLDRSVDDGRTVTIRESDRTATSPVDSEGRPSEGAVRAAQKKGWARRGPGSDAVIRWNAEAAGAHSSLARELVHAKRITTGTYTGGSSSGDAADPHGKADKEAQRAVGVGSFARRTFSENTIRREHGLPPRTDTTFKAGDWGPMSSPPEVPAGVTPGYLRGLVFGDPVVTDLLKSPTDNCADCATEVRRLLNEHKPRIAHIVRGIAMWPNATESIPENHLVIIVNVAGQEWVIDPTAAQFAGMEPMIEPVQEWKSAIGRALPNDVAKWMNAEMVWEATDATLAQRTAAAFPGEVIVAQPWYRTA